MKEKKTKIKIGIVLLFCTAAFVILAILSAGGKNSAIWVPIMFGIFAAIALFYSLYLFLTTKPKAKDENKIVLYEFFEDYLKINQDNGSIDGKNKALENCLYRKFKNKQYVSKVIEFENKFQINILVGTYNGAPQYKVHFLPKSIMKSEEELNAFKTFIKQKVEPDYRVKESKNK